MDGYLSWHLNHPTVAAASHLAAFRTAKIGSALEPGLARFAQTTIGIGLDQDAGERPLAVADVGEAKAPMLHFNLVTNRRFAGLVNGRRWNVRFSDVRGIAAESGLLVDRLTVTTSAGPVVTTPHGFQAPLVAYLQALGQVPHEHREPAYAPRCAPSEGDPIGARAAVMGLAEDDPWTRVAAHLEQAYLHDGLPSAIALDLVARISLQLRHERFGRGGREGRWLSPLSSDDLCQAFVALYGSPLAVQEGAVRSIELSSGRVSGAGAAAASTALGLASLAVLGVGWVSRAPRRAPRFRLMVADTGSDSSFRLGAGPDLHQADPELLHEIDLHLVGLEAAVLMRRALYGWQVSMPELMTIDDEALLDQLGGAAAEGTSVGAPHFAALEPIFDALVLTRAVAHEVIGETSEMTFEDLAAWVRSCLAEAGFTVVPGSEVDGRAVAASLASIDPRAAALAASRPTYGASFERGDVALFVMVDINKSGARQLQVGLID